MTGRQSDGRTDAHLCTCQEFVELNGIIWRRIGWNSVLKNISFSQKPTPAAYHCQVNQANLSSLARSLSFNRYRLWRRMDVQIRGLRHEFKHSIKPLRPSVGSSIRKTWIKQTFATLWGQYPVSISFKLLLMPLAINIQIDMEDKRIISELVFLSKTH